MLKYAGWDIVFQEVPGEVTFAVDLSLCPNRCPGCHSPYLRDDVGELLTADEMERVYRPYAGEATCLCLMGGDGDPLAVTDLLREMKRRFPGLKTAWYSGRQELPQALRAVEEKGSEDLLPVSAAVHSALDYVKLGPWVEACGPLSSPTTNQRFYRVTPEGLRDETCRFRKKKPGE